MEILWLLIGVVMGGAGAALVHRSGAAAMQSEVARLEAAAQHERERADEKAALVEEMRARLSETIEAAASRAVKGNNEEFLALAGQRLAPIDRRMEAMEGLVRELERAREGAYGSLSEQLRGLLDAQELLRSETGKLANALARPGTRGRWGEMTLRRLVELAGMVEHCDFVEQETLEGAGGRQRPDVVIRLLGGGCVAVDAKSPLDAYLAAAEATDTQVRERRLDEHARSLRDHMVTLGRKGYWEQFEESPDFVVMFVPGEAFVAAAAERRPDLFEEGFANRVVLATPATLMALLRVVALGWRQQKVAQSAREVAELGKELHRRIASMAGHVSTLGKRLDGAVEAFNKTVGSLERNVLPQARRFEAVGAGSKDDIPELSGVDERTRGLSAPELVEVEGNVVELPPGVEFDDDDYGTLGRAAP